jgi:hypothetical protein
MIPINNVVAGQDVSRTGGADPDEEIRNMERAGPDKDKTRLWRPEPMSQLSKRENVGISSKRPFAGMNKMRLHAAGLDIGAHEIGGCVPGEEENTQEVQTFGTCTSDLAAIGDWFQAKGVTRVAMESAGVYWIPVFEYLESLGLECCLISAAALKKVPGRKTDVLDSQWIQTWHSYGLLNGSFRPEADIVALRTLLRHRAQLVEHRSPPILHMQKALLQMNLQLSQVLTSITGQTGLLIIMWFIGKHYFPDQTQRDVWVNRQLDALWQGKTQPVISALAQLPPTVDAQVNSALSNLHSHRFISSWLSLN